MAQYDTPNQPAPASPIVAKRQPVIRCHLRSRRLSDEKPQATSPIVPTWALQWIPLRAHADHRLPAKTNTQHCQDACDG